MQTHNASTEQDSSQQNHSALHELNKCMWGKREKERHNSLWRIGAKMRKTAAVPHWNLRHWYRPPPQFLSDGTYQIGLRLKNKMSHWAVMLGCSHVSYFKTLKHIQHFKVKFTEKWTFCHLAWSWIIQYTEQLLKEKKIYIYFITCKQFDNEESKALSLSKLLKFLQTNDQESYHQPTVLY